MRLSLRSFPYPVLGNRDDVPGAAFQAAVEMSTDKQSVYIDVGISCSSSYMNSLLQDGGASIVLHVECSNTLFRKAYEFQQVAHRVSIPTEYLNEVIEVNVLVRANKDFPEFRIPESHVDYGDATFEVFRGDIIGIADGQTFHIDSNFDSLARIGAIMQITESEENDDIPMQPNYLGDKIVIVLSKSDFSDYKLLKQQEGLGGPLTTTIVLPVLVEALHILSQESEKIDDPRRWVRGLVRRIDNLGLTVDDTMVLELAQRLLELPIRRALSSARMLAEATN